MLDPGVDWFERDGRTILMHPHLEPDERRVASALAVAHEHLGNDHWFRGLHLAMNWLVPHDQWRAAWNQHRMIADVAADLGVPERLVLLRFIGLNPTDPRVYQLHHEPCACDLDQSAEEDLQQYA